MKRNSFQFCTTAIGFYSTTEHPLTRRFFAPLQPRNWMKAKHGNGNGKLVAAVRRRSTAQGSDLLCAVVAAAAAALTSREPQKNPSFQSNAGTSISLKSTEALPTLRCRAVPLDRHAALAAAIARRACHPIVSRHAPRRPRSAPPGRGECLSKAALLV